MSIDTHDLAEAIRREGKENISEATLRIRVEHLLADYFATIGVSYRPVHERRTVTRQLRQADELMLYLEL